MENSEKPAPTTPFEWIGGEDKVHALVERFYDLIGGAPHLGSKRGS